jgi:hypothetical protein
LGAFSSNWSLFNYPFHSILRDVQLLLDACATTVGKSEDLVQFLLSALMVRFFVLRTYNAIAFLDDGCMGIVRSERFSSVETYERTETSATECQSRADKCESMLDLKPLFFNVADVRSVDRALLVARTTDSDCKVLDRTTDKLRR